MNPGDTTLQRRINTVTRNTVGIASLPLILTAFALIAGCPASGLTSLPLNIFPAFNVGNESQAQLSGDNEVPPVTTSASGSVHLETVIAESVINFQIQAEDISDVTEATLNVGAPGTNGPIIFSLFKATAQQPFPGSVTRSLTTLDFIPAADAGINTFADAVAAVRAGNVYANISTAANPNGEIRGQVFALILP
jgi:hypothetical protein